MNVRYPMGSVSILRAQGLGETLQGKARQSDGWPNILEGGR